MDRPILHDLAVSTKEIVDAQSMHDLLDLCRINHRQITTLALIHHLGNATSSLFFYFNRLFIYSALVNKYYSKFARRSVKISINVIIHINIL